MELKERIIKETFNLLVSKSYKTLTMDEIAQSLGISKRTLYEQFPDKNDLLISCLKNYLDCHIEHCKQIIEGDKDPMTKFLEFMSETIETMSRIGYERVKELQKYNLVIFTNIFVPFFEQKKTYSQALLTQAKEEGFVAELIDIDFVINMIKENMFLISINDYLSKKYYSPIDLACAHIYIIIRGICTIKGLTLTDGYIEQYAKKRNINLHRRVQTKENK